MDLHDIFAAAAEALGNPAPPRPPTRVGLPLPSQSTPGAAPSTWSMETLRTEHPNAYKPWSPGEEEQLRDLFASGLSIEDIGVRLERQAGGIRSRLRKLGLLKE